MLLIVKVKLVPADKVPPLKVRVATSVEVPLWTQETPVKRGVLVEEEQVTGLPGRVISEGKISWN